MFPVRIPTSSMNYDIATSPENGFSDIKYSRFPYHEVPPKLDEKTSGKVPENTNDDILGKKNIHQTR